MLQHMSMSIECLWRAFIKSDFVDKKIMYTICILYRIYIYRVLNNDLEFAVQVK